MPLYEFTNPKTGEVVEVVQSMQEDHVFFDEHGNEWKRVWHSPNASIDTEIDAFSEKDWMRRTAKKGMTAGDMFDLSSELCNKREKSAGLDPIKQKAVTNYEKKTGKAHPNKSGNKKRTL
jgi:hypothetical protein